MTYPHIDGWFVGLTPGQMASIRAELVSHEIPPTGHDRTDAVRWVGLMDRMLQQSLRY